MEYSTIADLLTRVDSQRAGGIIIDQRFAPYIENNERHLQYSVIEELHHASLCQTMKDGYRFIIKTVPRGQNFLVQLRNYLRAESIDGIVPRALGVMFDNNDIKILFAYRKGHSLEEMMRMGRFIEGKELRRFISHLIEAVQKLHRTGISLLAVNPSSITLDEDCNLESIQFTNIQMTETSEQLSVDFPKYAPVLGAICDNAEDRKRYDMHGLGALVYFIMNKGRDIWHDVNPSEIAAHADSIYKRVTSLDQTQHCVMPYAVHLVLSLMNPNPSARPTAENALHHIFFMNSDAYDVTEALQRVNTHGHGCPYWVVTITDGFRVVYVTTAANGSTLREILSNRQMRETIGQDPEEVWYTHGAQNNVIPITSDMVIEIRMRQ